MGRITIFTINDCPSCKSIKGVMNQMKLPFSEISITDHPERKRDLLSLSNQLTVPQIFLNNTHIGGATQVLRILEQWGGGGGGGRNNAQKMYKHLVANAQDPTDTRLAIPQTKKTKSKKMMSTTSSSSSSSSSHDNNIVLLPDYKTKTSIFNITETLKSILPCQNLTYNLHIYRNSFRCSDGIIAIAKHFNISTTNAEIYMRDILQKQHHILDHVTSDHSVSNTNTLFFRLQCYQTPNILNSYRIWNINEEPVLRNEETPLQFLSRLIKMLRTIISSVTNTNGYIDYKQASVHELFPVLDEAICALQCIDVTSMPYEESLAFFINLYNFIIRFAYMKVGIPLTDSARNSFNHKVCFMLGNDILSIYELEHDILLPTSSQRRIISATSSFNKKQNSNKETTQLNLPPSLPKSHKQQNEGKHNNNNNNNNNMEELSSSTSSTSSSSLSSFPKFYDNRIHFTLSRNSNSCPNMWNYTKEAIHEELRVAALVFCDNDSNVFINENEQTIYLSRKFKWYRDDFIINTNNNNNNNNTMKESSSSNSIGSISNNSSSSNSNNLFFQQLLQFLNWEKKQRLQILLRSSSSLSNIKIKYNSYDWSISKSIIDSISYVDGSLTANPNRLTLTPIKDSKKTKQRIKGTTTTTTTKKQQVDTFDELTKMKIPITNQYLL